MGKKSVSGCIPMPNDQVFPMTNGHPSVQKHRLEFSAGVLLTAVKSRSLASEQRIRKIGKRVTSCRFLGYYCPSTDMRAHKEGTRSPPLRDTRRSFSAWPNRKSDTGFPFFIADIAFVFFRPLTRPLKRAPGF
jgi:hypothetical protein